MKQNKGFTLIELLAVIVILAIIALIATPKILGVIDKAKQGAADSSALGYVDAVEKQVMLNEVDTSKTRIADGTYDVPMSGVSVKGSAPTSGWLVIEKGEVTNYSFIINGYVVTKGSDTVKGDTATIKPEGGVASVLPAGLTKGTAVYINPETKTTCNETDAVSTTGTKAGCMKWYVYKDNGDSTYQLILDHNTTAVVAYNTSGSNTSMNEVATSLTNDTNSWNSSLNARLITADEIAEITGADKDPYNFNGEKSTTYFYFDTNTTTASTTCTSGNITGCQYGWLYDNTYDCITNGCNVEDSSNYGYWTSTPLYGSTDKVWYMTAYGFLDRFNPVVAPLYGVRPVITV